MLTFFLRIFKLIFDLFFPIFCLGCGVIGHWICSDCKKLLELQEKQVCAYCFRISEFGRTCANCARDASKKLTGVLVGCVFEEHSLLAKAIHTYKYDFIEPLSEDLSEIWEKMPLEYIITGTFSAIPLHRKRLRWRGFNQSALLLQKLGEKFWKKYEFVLSNEPLLVRVHFQKPQMELTRKERLKNVTDCFVINPKYEGSVPQCVVLVDDVATTLATLEEAAEVLRRWGVEEVWALVLARSYGKVYNEASIKI